MYQKPEEILGELIALRPNLVSVHAESDCDVENFANKLHAAGIKCGLAVFPNTTIESVAEILPKVDQLLIFSGNLGYQGGSVARLELLDKIPQSLAVNEKLEIAWDGGVNHENVAELAAKGVTVINAGGYIQHASNPQQAFQRLTDLLT
jgi:ribulose-phosphate 3-epimerase